MSEPRDNEPKPVHISVDVEGKVTATVAGEPIEVADLLAQLGIKRPEEPDA